MIPTPTRRGFLRGCGIALALPWLESLAAGEPVASASVSGPPKRLAVLFAGNGVNVPHWFPTVEGGTMKLSKTLAPLEAWKNQLLVVKGLHNPNALIGSEGHYPRMNVLAGNVVKRSTTQVQLGMTMDQVAAETLSRGCALGSLVLGTEPPRPGTELGYAQLYSGHLSWSSPTSPVPKEIRPRLAFDRLFDGGAGLRRDKSLLDTLRQDAQRLSGEVGAVDRRRLDAYLTSIRELEQRIQNAESGAKTDGWRPRTITPELERPMPGIPVHFGQHQQLMADIIVAAFRADRTRVATLMLADDLSGSNMGFIDGVQGSCHELSHHNNDPKRLAMYQLVNQWHMGIMARVAEQMQATDEGGTTLLDRTAVMFCSSLMDGNAHDGKQLPILLLGGKDLVPGGRLLDCSKHPDRRLCRLHLSLLHRLGIPLPSFGDADAPLDLG